jgi:hypothetical protein
MCRYTPAQGIVVLDSVNAFVSSSEFDITVYSDLYGFSPTYPFHLFDVIVLHYSVIPTLHGFIEDAVVSALKRTQAIKIVMAQDEYRSTEHLVRFANDLRASAFFTVVPEESAQSLYANLRKECRLVTYLTGYIPQDLCSVPVPRLEDRKHDIVYRGRKYPRWFGSIMLRKVDMAIELTRHRSFRRLRLDLSVSEEKRVYGRDWVALLTNSRATFATESDVEIVDPEGLMLHWDLATKQLLYKEDSDSASFQMVQSERVSQYTRPFPGSLAVIAPRIFEAIALRTALVMPPGSYSGVLTPWRHYIPLETDFSNADEVVAFLKDNSRLASLIATAYSEIAMSGKYTYGAFAARFDQVLNAVLKDTVPPELRKIDATDESDWESVKSELRKKYPFYYIKQPHMLAVSTGAQLRTRLLQVARRIVRRWI